MSLKLHQKIYWKARNAVQAPFLRILGNPGLLTDREDPRDYEADLGIGWVYKTKHESISHFLHQYKQYDNICTAAGSSKRLSDQIGVEVSAKATMRKMVQKGQVSGNGFSYTRAPLEVYTEDGIVTVDQVPDANDQGWNEFKRWDNETAKAFADTTLKATLYERLVNEYAVLEAIDQGYCPIFGSSWYSDMNTPRPPHFLLQFTGWYLGGHLQGLGGYKNFGQLKETPETFSEKYADGGKAWSKTIFGKGYFTPYIIKFDGKPMPSLDLLLPIFIRQNEGRLVRSKEDARCFVIDRGVKHYVSGDDGMRTFFHLQDTIGLKYVKRELLGAIPEGSPYPLIP